ncbi:MAG: hypothetical protein M0Z67_17765 [Nitrospiraceae bacterium]|nr:hypothetical protein [Nitrospiraceae bacterium]
MPRFTFFLGLLLTLGVCFSAPGPDKGYAMGSKSGFEHADKKETQKEQPVQGTEKDKGAEKGVRQENAGRNKEKSRPVKKPRLKYRDPYECGC